ncbi:MAG: HPr(Ser) kinase/phosphatase [Lachnospiraceae bacterium]|nr:HPr(Ser) kinase/phosphatase [Lachnospiraceae bacterium]
MAKTIKYTVKLSEVLKEKDLKLTDLTPEVDTKQILISQIEVNRTALQLVGYFEHFDAKRIQVIGKVEHSYLNKKHKDGGVKIIEQLMKKGIPCLIFTRNMKPAEEIIELGVKHNVPVLLTSMSTSMFISQLVHFLYAQLAPRITLHGVLVDVYGVGVLIMGESGIGKSEAALALIRNGHRLISDDVVEIRKLENDELVGKSPDVTRNFLELRGIGIIDVKALFGASSVKGKMNIDMVIQLEEWDKKKQYDRLGMKENHIKILGRSIICNAIPVRPGRNISIIVESAAANYREKVMGYNAADELYRRVREQWETDGTE